MITKEELIAQCKKENPEMFSVINDQVVYLNDEEYNLACENWAQMQLDILKEIAEKEKEQKIKAEARAQVEAKLSALGLTTEDLKALALGGN